MVEVEKLSLHPIAAAILQKPFGEVISAIEMIIANRAVDPMNTGATLAFLMNKIIDIIDENFTPGEGPSIFKVAYVAVMQAYIAESGFEVKLLDDIGEIEHNMKKEEMN